MGDDTDADERSDNREGQIRAKHKSSNDESDVLFNSCVILLFNSRLLLTLCQTAEEQSKRCEDNIREWTGLDFGKSQRAVGNWLQNHLWYPNDPRG